MAKSFRQFLKGILIRGETADASDNIEGSIFVNSTTNRLKMYLQSAIRTLVSEDQTQTLTNKTLSGNSATNLINGSGTLNLNSSGTATIPNATDTLVGKATTDTLTNKTIDGDNNTVQDLALTSLKTNITDASKFIVRDASGIPISNTKDVPSGVVVGDTDSQTLTNKVLTGNTAVNLISGAGTLTLNTSGTITAPNATDTLVGKATTDTLTNKTLTSPVINTPTGITKSDVGLGNVDNTSDATKNSASVTLTNKTIDGDNNTVQDLALTSLKTNITDASKFIVRDASGIPISNTKDVPSGVVVGTTDTQTLSAKTFSDAPILAEIATPSTPSSGFGKIYFKSDGFLYQLNDDGTETKVGAGSGGINYITNGDAESNTTGWNTFADGAVTAPIDGTGGSPNSTWTRSTSSPLRGTGSFLFTKNSGASRQGEGVSYDFTIADADKGKVLQGSFDYAIASGTFVDDALVAYIIADPSGTPTIIQPTPYLLKNHTLSSERYAFEFQTLTSTNSYRFVLFIPVTTDSSNVLKFDNFIVGPQAKLYGSPVTDWTVYTPTITFGSGSMTNNTVTGYWRRVGDSIELSGNISFTGAAGTWSSPKFSLPSGLSIDTAKLDSIAEKYFGSGHAYDTGSTIYILNLSYASTTTVQIYVGDAASTYTRSAVLTQAVPFTFASGDSINWKVSLPILGWGSSAITSSDASTRVVAARYELSASTSVVDQTVLKHTNKIHDTHNAYDTATGKYTCPVPGIYEVCGGHKTAAIASGNVTRVLSLTLRKNGSANSIIAAGNSKTTTSTAQMCYGATQIQCNAGDYLEVFVTQEDGTANSSATQRDCFVAFKMLTGPSQIAASETVAARYYASATSITGSLATISWTTKDYDTHGAVSSGTFTCPISGKYMVQSAIALSGTFVLNNTTVIEIQKNGTAVTNLTRYIAAAVTNDGVDIEDTINCLAGDTIRVQVSNSGTTPSIISSNTRNYFTVVRVGN